jgi:hypothetical protein
MALLFLPTTYSSPGIWGNIIVSAISLPFCYHCEWLRDAIHILNRNALFLSVILNLLSNLWVQCSRC